MKVLVDTSVWVSHFRKHNAELSALLVADNVLCHPLIRLELACGTPPARQQTLAALSLLTNTCQPSTQEVADFIERERLYNQGCGAVDMVLLCASLLTPAATLWTLDKNLEAMAQRFNVQFEPNQH